MKLKPNFYNTAATELKAKYFATEDHNTSENKKYRKLNADLELYSNGCMGYVSLITRLAKACNDSTTNIHAIVEKHVASFDGFQYEPK